MLFLGVCIGTYLLLGPIFHTDIVEAASTAIYNRITGSEIVFSKHPTKKALEDGLGSGKSFDFADLRDADLVFLNSGDRKRLDSLHETCEPMYKKISLSRADLTYSFLEYSCLPKTDLRGTILINAYLTGSNLSGSRLQNAKLAKAHLTRVNLESSNLSHADLKESFLLFVNLDNSNLRQADLENADLFNASLAGADLTDANLLGVDLSEVNLENAVLRRTKLDKFTQFHGANLSKVLYEPEGVPDIKSLVNAQGLRSLRIDTDITGLVELARKFEKAGFTQQARDVVCSIERNKEKIFTEYKKFRYLRWFFFDLTSSYGASPSRPFLCIIIINIFLFGFIYSFLLYKRDKSRHGVWIIPQPRPNRQGCPKPFLLRSHLLVLSKRPTWLTEKFLWPLHLFSTRFVTRFKLLRALAAFFWGLYVSFIFAFRIGFRDFNIIQWVTIVQGRDYAINATGGIRTLAGIQSLLSLYLFLLWLISAFNLPYTL